MVIDFFHIIEQMNDILQLIAFVAPHTHAILRIKGTLDFLKADKTCDIFFTSLVPAQFAVVCILHHEKSGS